MGVLPAMIHGQTPQMLVRAFGEEWIAAKRVVSAVLRTTGAES